MERVERLKNQSINSEPEIFAERAVLVTESLAVSRLGRVGSIDQFSDNTDLRSYPGWRQRLRRLLEPDD